MTKKTLPNQWKIDEVTTGDYHWVMKAVGVKQLKARLSEYLRAVKAGEIVLVTDRDEVVAELRPPRQLPPPMQSEDTLQSLADAGEITRARQSKGEWRWTAKGIGLETGTTEAILAELRAERRKD
ncbi:MAG: type II toxin-antitoxin system Phd/YefM family antitoxin [Longimicrobiales bacterium]|nr:type II toxin-antitoxin system Phd/YefM family antitoxin [Longimicrobiales bacterium]